MLRTLLLRRTTSFFSSVLIIVFISALGTRPSIAETTASNLLSLTESCVPIPDVASFKTDEGSRLATIPVCEIPGAIWFKADLDIDCDGGSTAACKADLDYLPDTSCNASDGKPLDAATLPFIVLPLNSNGLRISDYGIQCGTVAAVIYNNQVEFGIVGDRGPEGVIGEASYAMADRLGVNPDPNSGGTSSGVTYIIFTGSDTKVRVNQNHNQAVEIGHRLTEEWIAQNSTTNQGTITFQQPTSGQSFALGEVVTFVGTANRDISMIKLQADNRWELVSVPTTQGAWSTAYRFSGAGNRQITAIGFDSSGRQVSTQDINISITSRRSANNFSSNIVNIAKAEWEFFGRQTMDNGRLVNREHQETEEGYWQRIVTYWKQGVNRSDIDTAAEVGSNDNPWSAAFISYLMRQAGSGSEFAYSAAHVTYINRAIQMKRDGNTSAAFVGYKVSEYSPQVGDLVCAPRDWATNSVTYDNALTFDRFPSHCDLVVEVRSNSIDVIGGNVSNSVTQNTIKTEDGRIVSGSDRKWIVVIKNNLAHP